jgi:hypothetical protein
MSHAQEERDRRAKRVVGFASAAADQRLKPLSNARSDACAAKSSFDANCL